MDALVARFDKMVKSVAWGNGMSPADVADVSQEVWLKCFVHIRSIRQPERLASWLATTTHHECMRVWRRQGRVVLVADMAAHDVVADHLVAEGRVDAHDRDVRLRGLVTALPGRQQAVIGRLMSNQSPSYLEVADDLGVPVGSIGPTRGRGLRTLHAGCVGAGIGLA